MNRTFLLCLTSAFCFSQGVEKPKFSVTQIDSLSKNESCFKIFDYGNKIHVEKVFSERKTKIIGEGYGEWKINAHFSDSLNYKKLSREEKKKYDDKNTCLIIRADYSSLLNFNDGIIEKEIIYFYFNQDEIFYVKYQKDNLSINFSYSDIENKSGKNDELKAYLQTKANEIKKVWNER